MLHVVDALLPDALRLGLRELCEAHAALKQRHHGVALFSWRPARGQARSLHRPEHQRLMERYLEEHLLPLARPLRRRHGWRRVVVQHQQRPRLAHR